MDPKSDAIDLVQIILPANVMLPNSSSTLMIGNSLNMSDGHPKNPTVLAGNVSRMLLRSSGLIFIDVTSVDPRLPNSEGELQGQAVIFPSGMIALCAQPKKEAKK